MRRILHNLGNLTFGSFLLTSAALAQSEYPPCGSFALTGGEFSFVTIDHGAEGGSVGGERLGDRELLDDAGSQVGTLRWVSRVVDIDEGSVQDEYALNQLVYTLPNGTLHATGQLVYEEILAQGTQPSKSSIAIIGGTGDYSDSEGEIETTFEPDGSARFEFKLQCD